MNETGQGTGIHNEDELERLLGEASPRPTPSPEDEAAVRLAVRAEWSQLTSARTRRRRVMAFAMAATVLVGVFGIFNAFRTPPIEIIEVAKIERSDGPVRMLAQSAPLPDADDLNVVMSGQTIVTGAQAGIALAWGNGGSLRIDENTHIEFTSDNSVYLQRGGIYFDSIPSPLMAATVASEPGGFSVQTDHGHIKHIGTQFMARAEQNSLTVSVREGEVAIDGPFHDQNAAAGQQVTLKGRQMPETLSDSGFGERWSWIERTSPAVNVDGRSVHEFLLWASRELGLALVFEGTAEDVARGANLFGTIDTRPSIALGQGLDMAAFSYRIDEGVIYVSDTQ